MSYMTCRYCGRGSPFVAKWGLCFQCFQDECDGELEK